MMMKKTQSLAKGPEGIAQIAPSFRVYTGVCDPRADQGICRLLEDVSAELAKQRFTLRSGGSGGGEFALERGAAREMGKREVYLPWQGYNRHESPFYDIPQDAFRISAAVEPEWLHFGRSNRRLMARASLQLLGRKLLQPSLFVICWTPNGKTQGACRTVLRLAKQRGIPILNIGRYDFLPKDEMHCAVARGLRKLGIQNTLDARYRRKQLQLPA